MDRDDEWIHRWYLKQNFMKLSTYLHVYIDEQMDWFTGQRFSSNSVILSVYSSDRDID